MLKVFTKGDFSLLGICPCQVEWGFEVCWDS